MAAAPTHKGFYVPNAADVTKPELAEPDRIDFSIAGNARWGVLSGCLISVSTATASNTPGTALVNGTLVDVPGSQNTKVGSSGAQSRFDLVAVNTAGLLVTVEGTPSLDPVFPDPPLDVTVLAAVFCAAGETVYNNFVIDKRNMLADSLKTKLGPTDPIILNRNGDGNLFQIDGAGKTSWAHDTTIQRTDVGTLRLSDRLTIDDTLITGGNITSNKSVTAFGPTTGSNLRHTSALPSDASGNPGDIFQHSLTGQLYVHQGGKWEEIATLKSTIPVGTVVTSLQTPAGMGPGWLQLNGGLITEDEAGRLFNIPALSIYISTPPTGPRTMQLPDARRRVLLSIPDEVGRTGGQSSFTLLRTNLPSHVHNTRSAQDGAAYPSTTVTRSGTHRHHVDGGQHGHDVSDGGHAHHGADNYLGGGFIVAQLYGRNKIDAYFNDSSHTYSVEMTEWTRRATSDIAVPSTPTSTHQHEVTDNGDHTHDVYVSPISAHNHTISEDSVGDGTPVSFTPSYLAVYTYIRI